MTIEEAYKNNIENANKTIVEQQKEIKKLNKELFETREQFRNIFEENMRLKRDINLHGGKLIITELEVKESWK